MDLTHIKALVELLLVMGSNLCLKGPLMGCNNGEGFNTDLLSRGISKMIEKIYKTVVMKLKTYIQTQ